MPKRLLVVAGCGLAVAGVVALPTLALDRDDRPAHPAPAAAPAQPAPAAEPAQAALTAGRAAVDRAAATATRPIRLGTTRTEDGAVAAFASYATWLVASPAARAGPEQAIAVVAAPDLDETDARMLRGMLREEKLTFATGSGAYRVLASGRDAVGGLDSVMVEVLAPLGYGGSARWVAVGGVVRWQPDGWRLAGLRPREVSQPAAGATARTDAAVRQAKGSLELPGIGWRTFAGAR